MAADMVGLMHHDRAMLVALVGDAAEMGDDRVVLGQEVAADQHGGAVHRRRLHHDHGGSAPRPFAVVAEMPVARQPLMAHIDGVGAEDDAVLQFQMPQFDRREQRGKLGLHTDIPPASLRAAGSRSRHFRHSHGDR